MPAGKLNFLASFLLLVCLLGLANTQKTATTSKRTSDLADKRKVFITGEHIEVIVSSNKEANGSMKEILQKLKTVNIENKKLVKSVQSLEGRILALENKIGNAFLFPRKGDNDYIIINGKMPRLSAVTACFWMKAADVSKGTPLSYAVPGEHNEFIIYNYDSFTLWVGGNHRDTHVSAADGKWHHICATWENTAGSWKLYKDGVVVELGQGLKKGHMIRGKGSLVLGQEQDSVGGGFQASQSFVGEMTGVNIWDRVLGGNEIASLSKSCLTGEGSVFKWSDFKPHTVGGVYFDNSFMCYLGNIFKEVSLSKVILSFLFKDETSA